MDLVNVRSVRTPSHRPDSTFGSGERPLGGGTRSCSEEQSALTGLVDLTARGRPSEAPYDPVAPASAKAVRDAVGIPPHHQPMTRDRLRALAETVVL